jgi:hypothetical protein
MATSLAGASLAALAMSKRRSVREPAYLEFGLLMLLIPLISPQGWDYVLLLATPAVLLLLDRWREMPRPWQALTGVALAGMCFTIFDLMGARLYSRAMGINLITMCAFALVICLVNLRLRRLA